MRLKTSDVIGDLNEDNADPPEDGLLATTNAPIKMEVHHLNVFYGNVHALHDVSVTVLEKTLTACVGPSGSGKSTFLRALNRLHAVTSTVRVTGNVLLDGEDISLFERNGEQVMRLRQQVGMIFQHPNPFPISIFENVAYGVRLQRSVSRHELQGIVEQVLRRVALWDEVKDRLKEHALHLAWGQQRRLCLARALAVSPEVILLDEPCEALDPFAAHSIEELIVQLGQQSTLIIATTNPNLAQRVADTTCHFLDGSLVQCDSTPQVSSFASER
jgi:phosphate transport system ATP-binding protein